MKRKNEQVEYYKELYHHAKKRQKEDNLEAKNRVKYYKALYEQSKREN